MSLFDRVTHLSQDIGPRGSTTDNERAASEYIELLLNKLGLPTEKHTFLSATSAYSPFALAAALVLIGLLLFWQPQPVGAAAAFVIGLFACISVVLELMLCENPLRWLIPIDTSQNVSTTIAAREPSALPPVLITAHVDTNRTPLITSSPTWLALYRALIPLGLISIAVLLILFAIGVPNDARLLRQIALVPGAFVLVLFVLMLQAARAPFTRGANDNASGVAVALHLAEHLAQSPLQRRDVIIAFTGCEEVGGYGASAFMAAHRERLRGAFHVVIDHVGGLAERDLGPSIIRNERFLQRVDADPQLLRIAADVTAQHPDLKARAQDFTLAYSEMTTGARHGLRVIGLAALNDDASLPNWHVAQDVGANVSEVTLERSARFALLLMQAIDAEGQA